MARCTTRSRAVDHKGKVQESFAIKQWDKATAVKFIKNAMKQPGRPKAIVTDGLCSYGAALKEFGASHLQENARWINNRAENSHLRFRRRERTIARFRRITTLEKICITDMVLAKLSASSRAQTCVFGAVNPRRESAP
jgi:putative transposase